MFLVKTKDQGRGLCGGCVRHLSCLMLRNETRRTSSILKEKVSLTHNHQGHFSHVNARRLLDLALVGGGVRAPQISHGDGGVALPGVPREAEPARYSAVAVPLRLPPGERQDLEGGEAGFSTGGAEGFRPSPPPPTLNTSVRVSAGRSLSGCSLIPHERLSRVVGLRLQKCFLKKKNGKFISAPPPSLFRNHRAFSCFTPQRTQQLLSSLMTLGSIKGDLSAVN